MKQLIKRSTRKWMRPFIILFFHQPILSQTLSRIEPPNWWVGMKDPSLQIMLYGQDMGDLKATIKHPGVKALSSVCPENPNYLFLDLEVNQSAKPGNMTIYLQKGGEKILQFEYPLLAREANSADRQGYNSTDVMYLITPDRFVNGDTTNDEIPGMKEGQNRTDKNGRHGGDIEGIRQHLDYITNLGITALWINPVLENNMDRYSYHGYATTDFYKVDPRMGSNESFKVLTRECKQKGLKMIMDMIHNHCGSSHWWMKDLPTTGWINYNSKPYIETNHQKTLHPDPYAAPEDLSVLEDGWFVPTMPDLNVRNPYMATYLIQNSLWWIEYAGIDGIRMDTYLYPESTYMADWTKRVMKEYPRFNITGEVWFDQPSFVAYWQKGKANTDGYKSHLPSLFDFPIHAAMIKALTTPDVNNGGWTHLYEMLANDFQYPDPNQLVVFPDNHDLPRLYAMLKENISHVKMALAYVLTLRGIPQLYYGTEILMNSPANRDDGLIRSDFPGGWPGDHVNAFTGTGLTTQQIDIQSFVTKLLLWRKTATAIHQGQTVHYVPQDKVYVLFRYDHHQKVMIILNQNEAPYTLQLDRFRRVLGNATAATDILTGDPVNLGGSINLSASGPMILEIKE